jgi:hypothetical protein
LLESAINTPPDFVGSRGAETIVRDAAEDLL